MECEDLARETRPRSILFHESIQLPEHWDKSETSLNVDDDLLSVCSRRIAQQRTYCLLYTSPSPRDATLSRMPSSA